MRFLKEEYLVEGIADVRKYYPMISDNDFNRIIKLDPTTNIQRDKLGSYSKWLLTLFQKGKLTNEGHVKDLLNRFEKEKKNLKNKDIMSYKSMEDVDAALDDSTSYDELSARQQLRQTQKAVRKTNIEENADLVYEDSDWEVWVPKTYEASCKLGQGSNWCTASTSSDYYYNHYKDSYGGEYYILISKQDPNEKYQFHFESQQFMDRSDHTIDLSTFMSKYPQLAKFFTPICEKAVDDYIERYGSASVNTDGVYILDYEELAKRCSSRDMGESFLLDCFKGDIFDDLYGFDGTDYSTQDIINMLEYDLDEQSQELFKNYGYDINDPSDIEDISGLVSSAMADAERDFYMSSCLADFNGAVADALDAISVEDAIVATWDREDGNIKVSCKADNNDSFYQIQHLDSDDDYLDELYDTFADNFKFYEGYWYGYDKSTFNMYIADFIDDYLEKR